MSAKPSNAVTFTFWIGPERRNMLEQVKASGLRLDMAEELREAFDAVLAELLRKAMEHDL